MVRTQDIFKIWKNEKDIFTTVNSYDIQPFEAE